MMLDFDLLTRPKQRISKTIKKAKGRLKHFETASDGAEDGTQTRDPQTLRGQRWIRTTEGVSQQIYSLPHLATLVFAQHFHLSLSELAAKVQLFL